MQPVVMVFRSLSLFTAVASALLLFSQATAHKLAPRAAASSGPALAVHGCLVNNVTLPPLDFPYNALEPFISAEIMTLHHTKHHQAYVTNYNIAEQQLAAAVATGDVHKQLELQKALNFNGGGHINHSLFWKNLAPKSAGGGQLKDSMLKSAIVRQFGSPEGLQMAANKTLSTLQGSGWVWLAYNPVTKILELTTTKDQDPLLNMDPIIG